MAFQTTRVNGTSQGTINATWYNDFMQVMTGAMTNQPIYFYYQPSPGTNPPALKLQTNGNTHLLTGLNSVGTSVFDVDASGNLIMAGSFSSDGAALTSDGSGNLTKLGNITFGNGPTLTTLQSGAVNDFLFKSWNGSSNFNALAIGNNVSSSYAVSIHNDGSLFLGGGFTNSGLIVTKQSGSANGFTLKTWSGSAAVVPFSVGGQFNSALTWVDTSGNFNGPVSGGLPTTRLITATWTATSVPIYTGASAPTATQAPPTGAIYIGA